MSTPTHPDFGRQVSVQQNGNEVRLTFVAETEAQAVSLTEHLIAQLEGGHLVITLAGRVEKTVIEDEGT
jgi:hypothetical protein